MFPKNTSIIFNASRYLLKSDDQFTSFITHCFHTPFLLNLRFLQSIISFLCCYCHAAKIHEPSGFVPYWFIPYIYIYIPLDCVPSLQIYWFSYDLMLLSILKLLIPIQSWPNYPIPFPHSFSNPLFTHYLKNPTNTLNAYHPFPNKQKIQTPSSVYSYSS